jgi:hypothetical protein
MSSLFARGRAIAYGCLLAGAVLLPAVLGAFWLASGHLSRLAIAVAIGVSTLVELGGVAQLVVVRKARKRDRPRRHLQIQLCRTSLERLGPDKEPLLMALREREHSPVVKECLNRCQDCKLGMLVTTADGTPVFAKDSAALLSDLDELAASEA